MKIAVVLCALVATIFTQTDGKALGRAEVSDVEEVFSLVEERVKGLAELQFEAEQLQKINDQVKKTGLDLVENEELRSEVNDLKEKAKKLGYNEREFTVLKSELSIGDIEAIKTWAVEQYKKIKEALIELDKKNIVEGLIERIEKKAKETYKKLEEKAKSAYKKAEEKLKDLWSKLKQLG